MCGLDYEQQPVSFWPVALADKKSGSIKRRKSGPELGVQYKGLEIHRFPTEDQKERPLPSHLWAFLFPDGIVLSDHKLPPRFFVNALTYSDGTRSYVISIKFYEETPWRVKQKDQNLLRSPMGARRSGAASERVLYAPKAICYATQLPLFSFFKNYLAELFLLCQSSAPSSSVFVERLVSQLIIPVPLNFSPDEVFDHRYRINFAIGKSQLACILPNLVSDVTNHLKVYNPFIFNSLHSSPIYN